MKKISTLLLFLGLVFMTRNGATAQSNCPEGLNQMTVNTVTSIFGNEMQWSILDDLGQVYLQSSTFQNNGNFYNTACLPSGCYTVHLHDTFGDGWNGGSMSITVDSVVMFSGTLASGADLMFTLAINTTECSNTSLTYGCTDVNAANYDAAADINDGSCQYGGCTDPLAINFNPNADVLDSSCVYCTGGANAHLYICTFSNGNEVSLSIVDSNDVVIFTSPSLNNVAIYNTDICLDPNMCYTAVMTNNAGNTGWYNGYFWVNVGGVQIIHESLDPTLASETDEFSVDGSCGNVITYGCNDPIALNYNIDADVNDGSCVYPIMGCTQINALNYNSDATYDDGSCVMPGACGEMNMLFFDWNGGVFANECSVSLYNSEGSNVAYAAGYSDTYACINDGCFYTTLNDNFGDGWENTTLNIYLNGSPIALASPYLAAGSMEAIMLSINETGCSIETPGCMDATAMNYNPIATAMDSSCVYSQDCPYGWSYITTATGFWASEMNWSIVNTSGDIVYSFEGQNNNVTTSDFVCLIPDCYTVQMEDSWGDGWNGGYIYISNSLGYGDFYGTLNWGDAQAGMYSILSNCGAEVMGCMDSTALNYNPSATQEDGSCMYNDNNPQGENPGMSLISSEVKLYPNPANDYINVSLQGVNVLNGNGVQYHIYSADGKLVDRGQWVAGQINVGLNIAQLHAGVYFIQVYGENGMTSGRFVKQ